MHDPDFNGIELAWDRDPSYWVRDGKPVMERVSLDFPSLLGELGDPATDQHLSSLARYT